MSSIDIHRGHALGLAGARSAVEQIAGRLRDKFGASTQWDGNTLTFSRSGIEGHIDVADDAIDVRARLGLLLSAMKPMIEDEIRRKLDEVAGPAAP